VDLSVEGAESWPTKRIWHTVWPFEIEGVSV